MPKASLIILFLFTSIIAVFAQSPTSNEFVLEELVFDIDGMTREQALKNDINMEEGLIFSSEEDLMAYIEEKRQDMVNTRVFDYVRARTEVIRTDYATAYYRAIYNLSDSFTFTPLVYPNYDTNTGFRIGVNLKYANAFGTMTNWGLTANYDFGTKEYRINPSVSGVDLWGQSFSFNYAQSWVVEEKIESDITVAEWTYHQSSISVGTSFLLPKPWRYGFTPSFTFRYGYDDVLGNGNYNEDRFGFVWSHSGGASDINWVNNYRNGYTSHLSHSLRLINRDGDFAVVNTLGIGGGYYVTFARNVLSFYARIGYDVIFNDEMTGYGSRLRGVADNLMYGVQGAYANFSLAIQFWRWEGLWDAQIHPFVDIGLTDPKNVQFDPSEHFKAGAGVDLVLYLDRLRNLVARGSIGYNLTSDLDALDTGRLEISIATDLHY